MEKTRRYSSLNDAANNPAVEMRHQEMLRPAVAGEGYIEVWYDREPRFEGTGNFHDSGPHATHAKLGEVAYHPNWGILYGALQGEFWSPNGEACTLIPFLGLQHTSMSVGDVFVVCEPSGKVEAWMVSKNGWRQMLVTH